MSNVNADLQAEAQAAILERIKLGTSSDKLTVKSLESLARSYALVMGNPMVPSGTNDEV